MNVLAKKMVTQCLCMNILSNFHRVAVVQPFYFGEFSSEILQIDDCTFEKRELSLLTIPSGKAWLKRHF
ncbi:hypothetical protein EMIT0215P_50087 [Pseudomonas serboccidentalis]